MSPKLTYQDVINRGILDALAEIYQDPTNAAALLTSIGFPARIRPPFVQGGDPRVFWARICEQIEHGAFRGGFGALVAAAAQQYPTHPAFEQYRPIGARKPRQTQQSGAQQREVSITVTGWEDVDNLLATARQIATGLGRPSESVHLGFANAEGVLLSLENWTSEQALPFANRLRTAQPNAQPVQTSIAASGFRDYLLSRLFVEGPDQARFEVNDVRASTKVREVAQGIINSQYDPKMFGPQSGGKGGHQVVVDRRKEDGKTERLDLDTTLYEQNIRDGDTLHVSPESRAGCFLPGTLITLSNGSFIPIEALQAGSEVLTYDTEKSSLCSGKVGERIEDFASNYLIINGSLKITESHFVYANDQWVRAGALKPGDRLKTETDGDILVQTLELKAVPAKVYNLSMASETHTFFANGILVHNHQAKTATHQPGYVEQERSKNTQAFAVAQIRDHPDGQPLYTTKSYHLYAGIKKKFESDSWAGAPVELPGTDTVEIDVSIFAEDIEIKPHWSQRLAYDATMPSSLLAFELQPKSAGEKIIRIDFSHERRFLQTLEIPVVVIEAETLAISIRDARTNQVYQLSASNTDTFEQVIQKLQASVNLLPEIPDQVESQSIVPSQNTGLVFRLIFQGLLARGISLAELGVKNGAELMMVASYEKR